jgi:hypothetical protein
VEDLCRPEILQKCLERRIGGYRKKCMCSALNNYADIHLNEAKAGKTMENVIQNSLEER